jgi:hypothetical protein
MQNTTPLVWLLILSVLSPFFNAQAACPPIEVSQRVSNACHVIRYLQGGARVLHLNSDQITALIDEVRVPLTECIRQGTHSPELKESEILLAQMALTHPQAREKSGCRSPMEAVGAATAISLSRSVRIILGEITNVSPPPPPPGGNSSTSIKPNASPKSAMEAHVEHTCPGEETPENWERWAHETLLKKLAMSGLEADSSEPSRELAVILNTPSPLIQALAGQSISKLQALAEVLKIPGFAVKQEWNSWVDLTLNFLDPILSDTSYEKQINLFKAKIQAQIKSRQLGAEPVVLIPVTQGTVDFILRRKLDQIKNRLMTSTQYSDCVLAHPGKTGTAECIRTIIEPVLARAREAARTEIPAIKDRLYSQVQTAEARGFPYGFISREQFTSESQALLAGIRAGLNQAHPGITHEAVGEHPGAQALPSAESASLSEATQLTAGSIRARIGGSAASGLSAMNKGQGEMRTAFHAGSDFDISVSIPHDEYEWVISRYKHFQEIRSTHESPIKMPAKSQTFPLGVSLSGDPLGSAYIRDHRVAGEILNELKIFEPIKAMATRMKRDVNVIFFDGSKQEDPAREGPRKASIPLIE